MRYRLTLEGGLSATLDDLAFRHFLRQALRRRHQLTRVRGGYVMTLPGGALAALLSDAPPVN